MPHEIFFWSISFSFFSCARSFLRLLIMSDCSSFCFFNVSIFCSVWSNFVLSFRQSSQILWTITKCYMMHTILQDDSCAYDGRSFEAEPASIPLPSPWLTAACSSCTFTLKIVGTVPSFLIILLLVLFRSESAKCNSHTLNRSL